MKKGYKPVYKPAFICKPFTHADRIRALSDEELAKWLCDMAVCQLCPIANCPGTRDCETRWLDWLKKSETE